MALVVTSFREGTYVKPQSKIFYATELPIRHYQLRHFISTADKDIVYYITERDVCALHTKSRRRERIASLPFLPQCLGAGYGWICVGGPRGRCAFIDVRHCRPFSQAWPEGPSRSEVIALIPLNLNPHPRMDYDTLEQNSQANLNIWIRTKVHPREIGQDIVNSITIHKLKAGQKHLDDEEVAVVSSNDKTVQIFSLRQLQVLAALSFPCQMNHASISPDGRLLIACGDEMSAYFFRRVTLSGTSSDGNLNFAQYRWEHFASVALKATSSRDTCFSTAFSPSGHICTFASQFGSITVFDTSRLREDMADEEAVIDSFTSTRPAVAEEKTLFQDMPGAIRSAAFSPEPWDLLAWAEDQGRICVADIRDGFRSRQVIQVDVNATDLDRVEFPDTRSEEDEVDEVSSAVDVFDPTFLTGSNQPSSDTRTGIASVQSTADYIEYSAERRRQRRDNNLDELTDAEREILETMRVERLRESLRAPEESRDLSTDSPFSIHYSGLPPIGSYPTPGSQNTSIRQYMRERNLERNLERNSTSSSPRAYPPRRQSSVVISNSGSNNVSASSPNSSTLAPITSVTNLSTSPSRMASSNGTSPNRLARATAAAAEHADAWHTISLAVATASSRDSPESGSGAAARVLQQNRTRDLQRHQNLLRQEQQALERRRSRQRELEEARAQVLALANPGIDEEAVRNLSRQAHEQIRERLRNSEREHDRRGESSWPTRGDRMEQVSQAQYRMLQDRAAMMNTMVGLEFLDGGASTAERIHGPAVMGVGWSGDGRKLFVATEQGIFEFEVDLEQRRSFPSFTLR